MHRDVYDTHQLRVIDDVQLMTESHAAYQVYADSVLWCHESLSGILAATFLMNSVVFWVQIWTVRGI